MVGLWIGLSARATEDTIQRHLMRWFPRVEIMTRGIADASKRARWPSIVFEVDHSPKVEDFPYVVDFACFPGPDDQAVLAGLVLARRLSSVLRCRAISDGSRMGDNESPYWSIIWERRQAFLAYDLDTVFADGEGGQVLVVRPITPPAAELNEHAAVVRRAPVLP
ncbi:MAG: hypothetical protein V4850_32475 [Myxococcota bacterium]